MLYSDYLKDKSHNAIKFNEVEGVPCILTHSKGKDLKNYEIYGNSYQAIRSGKNLLSSNATTSTLNGVTLTYDNGTIILNGTCDTSANFDLNNIVLSAGTYTLSANANKIPVNNGYAFVQLYDSTNNQTITLVNSNAMSSITTTISDGTFLYRIRIDEGTTYDNVVLKPQLEVGSTATAYEQYGVMPSPEFLSEIQGVGEKTKNLFDISNVITGYTVGITGELAANAIYNASDYIEVKPNTTYTFTIYNTVQFTDGSNSIVRGCLYTSDKTMISICCTFNRTEIGYNTATFTTSENTQYFRFGMRNTDIKIQFEEGSTATEYEPYHKYKVPIKVSGKNLLSKWYSNMYYSSCTKSKAIYMEPGTYNYHFERVDDTVTKWRYTLSIFDVDGGENDRITGVTPYLAYRSTNGWYCNDYGLVQSTGDVTYNGSANVALTVLKPCYIMWMLQLKNSSGTILDAKKYAKNVMLEKGEQYTGYEDYAEPITQNIYLDEPLRKVGGYSDYVDFKKQKVVRNIKEVTFNGTENWSLQGINENGIISFICSISNETAPSTTNISALSSHFPYKANGLSTATEQGFLVQRGVGATNIYIRMLNEDIADIAAFKTWLSENNVTIYYKMATPTEEPISLPTLQTFKGTTIMSVDTTVLPSNIKATYIRT